MEGFRTLRQASSSLLCLLRGRKGLQRLCEHHPVVGPLYCLFAVGIGFWVLGCLCAAILIQTYQMVQADIYRPSMEPQDYEMVQFLIKRLKLWMGLSRTKEVQISCLTIRVCLFSVSELFNMSSVFLSYILAINKQRKSK